MCHEIIWYAVCDHHRAKSRCHLEFIHSPLVREIAPVCGIVGYTGRREAEPILLQGLARLEYRGYDSAGMATVTGSHLCVRKTAGRIPVLSQLLSKHPAPGTAGISHTRWATHGGATDANAHPHVAGDGAVAVVHNGVIENYTVLKRQLQADGC